MKKDRPKIPDVPNDKEAGTARPVAKERIRELELEVARRKRAEEVLRKEVGVLRQMFDAVNEAIFIDNAETGKMIDCNARTVELYGYGSKEEILAGNMGDLSANSDQYSEEKAREYMRRAIEEGPQTFEWLAKKKDGEVFWVEMGLRKADIAGNIRLIMSTAWDITDRKRAEQELMESEVKFKAFMDCLPGFAYIKDENRRFVFIGPQTAHMLGIEPGKGLGRTHEEISPTPEALQIKANDEEILLTHALTQFEEELWVDGEQRTFLSLKFPITRPDGGALLGGISLDITKRRKAEEACRLSEEKLSKAFNSSPDWMTISTLEAGLMVEVNDSFLESSGFSRAEVIGRTSVDLGIWVDPLDRDRLLDIVRKDGSAKNFESLIRYKSGDIRIALWSAERIDLDGRECMIASMRDITEQRTTRKELEASLDKFARGLTGTVQALAMTTEMRDPYTAGHQKRVAELSVAIAREMDFQDDRMNGLRMAASIHDLGKISIPAEILSRPAKLTPLEFSLIKGHSEVGYGILKDIDFPWPLARIVLEHHERMNGSGYPYGRNGALLLLESKVLMVADVVEAIATHRPYRPALGIDAALEEVVKNKGVLYEPAAVEACLAVFKKDYRLE